ncbi:MAG TPA: serine/threonine protein kinase [Candidatus Melainabacteria bacterium]|nr:serine/threonine protein kinase [Candidatus Melainabacteria bacterium]
MSEKSDKKPKKEPAKLKADQIPSGAESAFLSGTPELREKIALRSTDNKESADSSAVRDGQSSAENDGRTTQTDGDSGADTDGEETLVRHRMDTLVGTVLANRYELQSFIGQGGMSVVYKGQDKVLGKTVAIKLLLPHLVNDPITYARFQQEARAASSLSHTNIVSIYDFGAGENNEPYIVMDYLDGTPLNDAIRMLRGLALERSVAIFVQIADALQCAHSNNVLHRDLKPSNVLLIHQGPALDIVKLVDFGIAKLIPQDGGESLHLTKTGEVFGSPLYMSPEQCRGEKVDARSDVYSMGCLMYEVIAGKPPIVGANLMETLYKQLGEVPASFSVSCPDSKVPERLEAIVFKAFAKDPAMRHQSMEELAKDLHEFLDQMDAGWITNAKLKLELLRLKIAPFVGREKKLLLIALAAVVVCAVVAAQYLSIYFRDVREPPPRAASAWSVIQKPPEEKSNFATYAGLLQADLKTYAPEGQTSPRYINGQQILAKFYEDNGHYREALDLRKKAYESLKESEGEKTDDTMEAQWNFAKTLGKTGNWYDSVAVYSDLYHRLETDPDIKDPNKMGKSEGSRHAMFNNIGEDLANALYASGRYSEAAIKYELLLSEYKKYKETSNPMTKRRAEILCRLGDCYRLGNQFANAEKAYEGALKIWSENDKDTSQLIATTRLLAFVHFQQGHYKRARYLYETALPKMESELGESDPEVIAALREYSQLMWKKGNYVKSVLTDLRVKELQSRRQRTS